MIKNKVLEILARIVLDQRKMIRREVKKIKRINELRFKFKFNCLIA
jgi:hypothetical protein